jgi:glyoxylase-like metal-dependent hydrolase (beta-lactamase superfamily II)
VPGGWTVTRNDVAPIHTFTASEDGWLVNSHVIEFPSQLFVIDAQYTLPNAREVVRYARGLRKPMTRLIITHYHPDHILGAAAFDVPLYTLESVAEKIGEVGDRVAQEEREKVGGDIPATARQPNGRIVESAEILDGVKLELRRLKGAETEDALTIALPDAGAIIVQDLVYNQAHPFLGERRFDGWRAALRAYQALPHEVVLPGHGLPGAKSAVRANAALSRRRGGSTRSGSRAVRIPRARDRPFPALRRPKGPRPSASFSVPGGGAWVTVVSS